jgi:holo-[acyl-carrier protein] synthase
MEIAGLGTQIVDCLRVRRLIDKHADLFLEQVYTPREMLFCRDRRMSTEHYAALWASKEAVFRSLGTTWRKGISWKDIELICSNPMEPVVIIGGPTYQLQLARGVTEFKVTMAHSRQFATATAIALRG